MSLENNFVMGETLGEAYNVKVNQQRYNIKEWMGFKRFHCTVCTDFFLPDLS